jgi:hypothetical protein
MERSAAEIVQDVARDLRDMVRAEVRMAKAEVKENARKAAKAGGMFGGAAVLCLFSFACFVAACVWALALVMPWGAAALLVSILLGAVSAALYKGARNNWRRVNPVPQRTVQTVKEHLP